MDKNSLFNKIKEFGLNTREEYMAEAFSRNIGLLTQAEQDKLANAKVAIPGMGGVGGVHLITMTRTGVGNFHIADFDTYEPANINRQFGARVPEFGRPKMQVMKEQALSINPYLEIKEFPEGISSSNIDDFLDGVQVVIDGLDFFKFDIRRLLFNRAREKGVYVITAGPMGFSSAMLIFSPNEGMGFDEYFNIVDGMKPQDQYLSFALGLAPRATHIKYMDLSKVDLESKAGPSLNIACQICSGMAATEAVRIILNKGKVKPVPYFFQFDPYVQKYRKGNLLMGNRNPVQRIKLKVVKKLLARNKWKYKPSIPEFPAVKAIKESIPEEVIRYIISAGIQAPSGDNVQPWKFSFKNNTISLYLDKESDNSFFNINQIASIISCGAVLENMRIAASAFDLKANINLLPSNTEDDLMATIELIYNGTSRNPLFASIWKRNTNRTFYEKKPIPSLVLNDFKKSISDISGAKIHFVIEKDKLKKLAKIIYKTDRIRTENRSLHEYLGKMIRYSHEEAIATRDGLPLKNLEAGLAGEIFLKATRPWFIMNLMNKTGIGRMVALHSFQGIINSSGAALLTVDGMNSKDFLKGGQALERIWLAITQQGLVMQPMTAITLFWQRCQIEGEKSFAKKHRKLLQDVWEEYQSMFQEVNFSREGQVMLFRFGYGREIKYGTYRKDVNSFLR
ncbi:MAG: ThiF family adenylyltransferase [Proteobacteria bacterium]|nr:ThiF family adenylyltransferase [Pseudomonadota bacterium]MBU4287528.1 ThiF family adenylyltransferase [Pseudomonadota bacterium]